MSCLVVEKMVAGRKHVLLLSNNCTIHPPELKKKIHIDVKIHEVHGTSFH